jgi:hypothetical protein
MKAMFVAVAIAPTLARAADGDPVPGTRMGFAGVPDLAQAARP